MGVVLAGFIGRPSRLPETAEGYQTARYRFSADETSQECKLFSIALRQHLINCGRAPRLWLLLGTPGSIWDALSEVVPESKRDKVYAQIVFRLHTQVRTGHMTQPLLDEWGRFLSDCLGSEIKCQITGDAGSSEEPDGVFAALESYIQVRDEVVFDVTHGLRHQPIVASFSMMFLRWIKNVTKVDFLYGAFELRTDSTQPCPVIALPVCQQLSKACEAVATYQYTGSFQQIGQALCDGLDEAAPRVKELADLTRKVSYSDEVNHPDRGAAESLILELNQMNLRKKPVKNALAGVLSLALRWLLDHKEHDEQMLAKARNAMKRQQRFKAVAYLYEAVNSAICRRHGATPEELGDYNYRKPKFDEVVNANWDAYGSDLRTLEWLRNAVLHGTNPITRSRTIRNKLDQALRDPSDLKVVFDKSAAICERIMDGSIPVQ